MSIFVRPRKKIDAAFSDLFMALLYCLTPRGCEARSYPLSQVLKKLENTGPRGTQVGLNCLSVRSAFDLLLTSLHLPVGSEVLMTAANIPDMFEIVRRHGLIPVTLDLHTGDFAICEEDLERKLSEKTSLVLIAHLFGSRTDLTPIVNHPHREDFVLVEDCAQLFVGDYFPSSCLSDFQVFSFGPIKTATALEEASYATRRMNLASGIQLGSVFWRSVKPILFNPGSDMLGGS